MREYKISVHWHSLEEINAKKYNFSKLEKRHNQLDSTEAKKVKLLENAPEKKYSTKNIGEVIN